MFVTGLTRLRLPVFSLIGSILLSAPGPTDAHETPRQRPAARGPINPRESFPFLVLSGAGGHFHSLLLSPGFETIYAGTHLGLFRSEDRGLTWRLAAPRFSREEVHGVAGDPKVGVLHVATHGQGLLTSQDGGRTWSAPPSRFPGRDVHALALAPRSPSILYVWVVGTGLLRSDDAGRHWSKVAGAGTLTDVEGLAVHPEKSERLYAATAKGLWLSQDGGKHWALPDDGLSHRAAGVALAPWRPDQLFATTLEGIFVGKDDGTGWEPLPSPPAWWGLPIGLALLPEQPDRLFVVTHEGVVAALQLSGKDWAPLATLQIQ